MIFIKSFVAATQPRADEIWRPPGDLAPDAGRRHLELLIAGMRPSPPDLAHAPLSQASIDRILTSQPALTTELTQVSRWTAFAQAPESCFALTTGVRWT